MDQSEKSHPRKKECDVFTPAERMKANRAEYTGKEKGRAQSRPVRTPFTQSLGRTGRARSAFPRCMCLSRPDYRHTPSGSA